MRGRNWLATDDGQYYVSEACDRSNELTQPYRLYRFLTDLEDLLAEISDDRLRLQAMYPLVRRLLSSSEWLQFTPIYPDNQTGWEVLTLYDEPSFPLTVQLVTWASGTISPIHNHGCWGLVAMLTGEEKNTLWRLQHHLSSDMPSDKVFKIEIEPTSDLVLAPGDILGFMPEAIHQIKALGNEPTVSFNIYGETDYERRFEFDWIGKIAKNF
jgi:predicted metal-dependent enzyme (double-stranded beta helix superfamily)